MRQYSKQQAGIVLVVSLIVMLLLTLIGTTAVHTATLEEKIAGNTRNRDLAFQAAESALLAGESYVGSLETTAFNCKNGLFKARDINCDGTQEAIDIWENPAIWSDNSQSIAYIADKNTPPSTDLAQRSAYPRYIIEIINTVCTTPARPCPIADQQKNYRVTARATGSSVDSVVMLQSIYSLL
ncbi:pilus assembly PilX family protein [Crenothrix polyspora]|jgi:type IV pilus assembly protein PilX|uniref:Tfp pilus assembly protein PilX n=1 Tax=Crenothrix polyspora TaxID=360316 RepID=A0A1R4H7V3_9GAMM